MTPMQALAYNTPCYTRDETKNPKYRHLEEKGKYLVSVILTVNIGPGEEEIFKGRALWHCSAALFEVGKISKNGQPIHVDGWSEKMRGLAEDVIEDNFNGVGDRSENDFEKGQWGIHVRHPLTTEEEKGLPYRRKLIGRG